MLSAAKHPQWLYQSQQLQIVRAVYPERSERAQNDRTADRHPAGAG